MGQMVAVGANGTILTSSDGVTWVGQNSGTPNDFFGVTFQKDSFVAVGDLGIIKTSPTGTTWTTQSSGTRDALDGIASGGFRIYFPLMAD